MSESATDPNIMTSKERFDACMMLADFWSGRGDSRREYERRFLFTFCALMVAVVVYLPRNIVSETIVGLGLLGFVLVFLRGNWTAAAKDKVQAWYYVDAAMEIISNPTHRVPEFHKEKKFNDKKIFGWRPFLEDWSQEVQLGVALLFAVAFWSLPQLAKLPQLN